LTGTSALPSGTSWFVFHTTRSTKEGPKGGGASLRTFFHQLVFASEILQSSLIDALRQIASTRDIVQQFGIRNGCDQLQLYHRAFARPADALRQLPVIIQQWS
jgi:hypothetical protein